MQDRTKMRRRDLVVMLGGAMLGGAAAALAQDSDRLRHIGILMPTSENDPETSDLGAVFRQEMQELGWTGGRNLRVDYRWGDGDARRIATLATQMVADGPDVILAGGSPAVAPLQRATSTIPIVFISASDAVAQGFVQDLAHPGGNITGFTSFSPDMAERWLALLRQLDPFMARVAVLYNPATAPYTEWFLRAAQGAPSAEGVKIEPAAVHAESDIDRAMDALERAGHGGLLVPSDAFTLTHSQAVIDMAARHRLPAVYAFRVFAGNGGLASYGVDLAEQMRLAAKYIDRILSGTSPGDLPVQEPTKLQLAINVRTAKTLGLTVPQAVLARADEVIE
jgi:putative tryptophan/tyrosine transport system substrate-binding protein